MWPVASFEAIKSGKVTDVYFPRAIQVLRAKGVDKRVRMEFITRSLPDDWHWAVLAGVEDCLRLLEGMPVSVRAMPEGTIFRPFQPVMEIEGKYTDFAVYETALLGMLCQASGIATKAARFRKLAGERRVTSFGARRMHPALAPMIERAAYIGGCDGVATVAAAELLGIQPSGTMPHAMILILGSTVEAARAFDEIIDPSVGRVALVDTFNDEKFEAINVAEALGKDLYAIRLDTPASRRGNFYQILEEVRWELDLRGYDHVRLFVSGGVSETLVRQVNDLVDAYGIGTEISNAPVVDFAMDIVEIEGKPLAKKGKLSGSKSLWRCDMCAGEFLMPRGQQPRHDDGGALRDLLEPLLGDGRLVRELPSPAAIRERVLKELELEEVEPPGHGH